MSSTTLAILPKPKVREWVKQVAVWLCIATLFPLTTWYATAAFHPAPDEEDYQRVMSRYNDSNEWPKDQVAREKFSAEKDRLAKEHEAAEKDFYRVMFWVTYPCGLLAILVGLAVPVQAIGAGFMFGGIFALSSGCYSAWDALGRWAHFWSLIIALIGIVIGGFLRLARPVIPETELS